MSWKKEAKHVIVLDEVNRKPDEDEAEELLKELDGLDEQSEDEADREPVRKAEKPEKKKAVKTGSKKSRLIIILAVSLVILTVVVLTALENASGSYREPVEIYEKYLNLPSYDGEELSTAYANGLAKKELGSLRTAMKDSAAYSDMLDASRLEREAEYKCECALYGDDHRKKVRIKSAVKLSEDELAVYESELAGIVNDLSVSSMARSDDPKLRKAFLALVDKLRNAHITRGYLLKCEQEISGSTKDGPVSVLSEYDVTVVKLNGHYIMWDKIYDILRMTY